MSVVEIVKTTAKSSDFIVAYDFEVYDILRVTQLLETYRPLMYTIIGLYVFAVYFGQKVMKNRPAYNLSFALFVWNVGLAVFSIVVTLRGSPEVLYLLSQKDGLYLSTCNRDVHNYATSFWGLMFLFSKIVEFGDTAFIILRKQKLIVLHWFHHAATLLICWLTVEFYATWGRYYGINSFVHSLMYSYYALKAVKVQIPKKVSQALTMLQISQLVLILVLGINLPISIAAGKPCAINPELTVFGAAIIVIFTVLFVNFFVQSYWRKPAGKPKSS